jgi:cyclophilin family peptidyl-prolyl cis-trans isomerase
MNRINPWILAYPFAALILAVAVIANLPLTNAQSTETSSESTTYTEQIRKKQLRELDEQMSLSAIHQNRSEKFGTIPESTPPDLKQAFDKSFRDYRNSIGLLTKIYWQHQVAWDGSKDVERLAAYGDAHEASHQALNEWRSNMAKVYAAQPKEGHFVLEMMIEMLERDCPKDLYDGLLPIAKTLFENASDLSEKAYEEIGYVGFANHDFDLAEEAWRKIADSNSMKPITKFYQSSIDQLRLRWEDELKARQADLKRDDNPRVSILTNKGRIVVELFETEAPQAVASFVMLVERKFYDLQTFYRVIDRSGAQAGCDRGDGSGNAGYTVRGEMGLPNHRPVMGGSLMLLSGKNAKTDVADPDSGSSQFAIAMLPQPALDGQQTVFGRVVEGMHVIGLLNRLDLSDEKQRKDKSKVPDKIIEARIIRKRQHEYKPEPVRGKLP